MSISLPNRIAPSLARHFATIRQVMSEYYADISDEVRVLIADSDTLPKLIIALKSARNVLQDGQEKARAAGQFGMLDWLTQRVSVVSKHIHELESLSADELIYD